MNNKFDEVDDILSEMESETSEADTLDLAEKNFNESELHDIMAEIESLEKEFETETEEVEVAPKIVPIQAAKLDGPTDLQSEIDRELDEAKAKFKNGPAPIEAAPKASQALPFEKKSSSLPTPLNSTRPNSEISMAANGQMNLNLGFKIGDEDVKLLIDPVNGLIVTLSGVELCINEENGCKVTMASGARFTIPLTSSESASKKKSA